MELRPLRQADLEPLSTWLPVTAAEVGCKRWVGEDALHEAIGKKGILAGVESGVASFVCYEIGSPQRDTAWIRLLAVAPHRRRLGIGNRAVLALESRLAGSVARIYVLVPQKLGLALYFWLRLGYRPLTRREWPARPDSEPAIWMVRPLV